MYGVVVCIHTYSLTSKGENLIITRVRVSSSVRRKSISHGQSAATETNISLTLGYTQQLTKRRSKPLLLCPIPMFFWTLSDSCRISLMLKGFLALAALAPMLIGMHLKSPKETTAAARNRFTSVSLWILLVYMPCKTCLVKVKDQKETFLVVHCLCIYVCLCIDCM